MRIIDIFDKILLIRLWIHAPSPTDNPHIALGYGIARDRERLESILHLAKWVKCIHLRTLDGWLIRDIALREIVIGRTVDALSWTSPKLGEERNHRNARQRPHRTLSQNFADTELVVDIATVDEFLISLYHRDVGWSLRDAIFRKNAIFETMKRLLGVHTCVFCERKKNLIDDVSLILHS